MSTFINCIWSYCTYLASTYLLYTIMLGKDRGKRKIKWQRAWKEKQKRKGGMVRKTNPCFNLDVMNILDLPVVPCPSSFLSIFFFNESCIRREESFLVSDQLIGRWLWESRKLDFRPYLGPGPTHQKTSKTKKKLSDFTLKVP